jgi:hypothetical protein
MVRFNLFDEEDAGNIRQNCGLWILPTRDYTAKDSIMARPEIVQPLSAF